MWNKLKKEIVAKMENTAPHCFIGNSYANIKVTGLLVEYELFGFKWYRIKVYCPKVRGICDGHYYTRATLNAIKSAIKTGLTRIKFERRYGCNLGS